MGRLADVMETESLCHGSGKICRELTNLGLNVTEIGVTRPATHLLDDVVVAPSEFEAHGPPRAQTVGADALEIVAVCFEIVEGSSFSDGRADVVSGDRLGTTVLIVKGSQ